VGCLVFPDSLQRSFVSVAKRVLVGDIKHLPDPGACRRQILLLPLSGVLSRGYLNARESEQKGALDAAETA
jgi:hypothetical protein